ncbi:CNK1B [Auxenochlorella protothecoides x Auxenochlorella symbiontica]
MPSIFDKLHHKKLDPFKGQHNLCLLKHFHIVKELGSGSYSHVYQVQRVDDGREYALKATDMSKLSSVERISLVEEIRYLASLSHPNIVRYYEAFVEEQWLCIITELVLGGDVATLIENTRNAHSFVPEDSIWSIFLQTALALEELHNCKILHRDVKPANLLINGNTVKLTDFGISRILERIFTRTQIGTPYYMSPEMWAGKAYSLSSDVWALGCLTLELGTLRLAFPGETDAEVERNVMLNQPPLLPPRYSDNLDAVVKAMMNPCPIQRPTITEILAMPEVRRQWNILPAALLSKLHSHNDGAPAHHILQPIQLPKELRLLNSRLPPAQYETGEGMAFLLSRPMSSSAGDLAGMDGQSGAADPPSGLTRSNSISNFEAVGHGGSTEGPRWADLRRKSVQVGSLAYSLAQLATDPEEQEKGLGFDEAGPVPDPLPTTPAPPEKSSSGKARRTLRASVTFAAPEGAGAGSPRRPNSAALMRKSVVLADVQGMRTRSEHDRRAALRDAPAPEIGVGAFGGGGFELCPVARKSFVVPTTSRQPVLGDHPERAPTRAGGERGGAGVRAGAAVDQRAAVAWPGPAETDASMHQPMGPAAAGNGYACPESAQTSSAVKSRKQPKKGSFFKRLFH